MWFEHSYVIEIKFGCLSKHKIKTKNKFAFVREWNHIKFFVALFLILKEKIFFNFFFLLFEILLNRIFLILVWEKSFLTVSGVFRISTRTQAHIRRCSWTRASIHDSWSFYRNALVALARLRHARVWNALWAEVALNFSKKKTNLVQLELNKFPRIFFFSTVGQMHS